MKKSRRRIFIDNVHTDFALSPCITHVIEKVLIPENLFEQGLLHFINEQIISGSFSYGFSRNTVFQKDVCTQFFLALAREMCSTKVVMPKVTKIQDFHRISNAFSILLLFILPLIITNNSSLACKRLNSIFTIEKVIAC